MQRITEFKTTLSPADASSILRKYEESESRLIHEEYHDAGDGKVVIILIFERYFLRTSGRGSMTVILENMTGSNKVRCITAGSGDSLFNFDLGASRNFRRWVEEALSSYIEENSYLEK